jgi:flavin-dependent dehydrogenase
MVVRAFDPDEAPREIRARFVVDATGRDALLARDTQGVERIPHLDRTALFTQVRGAWRDVGEREGDIQIVVSGEGAERGWFWLIPFADGRTSVGAVVSSAWVQAHRGDGGSPEALFDAAVREAPTVARMLEGTERGFAPRATADFSFRVQQLCGDGWVAIGDAGGFLDPLFSTGAHLALHGGLRAAEVIDRALHSGDTSAAAFAAWEREMRSGASLFLGAVQAFYSADLVDYLFAEPQHPFLRRAITSMLSGDVFDDARWAREMRARFPPRA